MRGLRVKSLTVRPVVKSLGRWLFAVALSMTLLFQACGAEPAIQSDGAVDRTNTETSSQAATETLAADPLTQEHKGDSPTATPLAVAEPIVPVNGQSVTYGTITGQPITGYLAQPSEPTSDALPALLTIHEWWGLNENIEAMTRRLAGEGYTVLAVDLYDDEVATDPQSARDLVRLVMDNPGPAEENILQAANFLETEYNASALGSIGWCFGGSWSLRTGLLLSSDLDAMAIYYGQLILDSEALATLDMPIIGFFGEEDSSIPVIDVQNFESTLERGGKAADINLYSGVGHAFANPSGQNYDANAAEDAWEKTITFFNPHLKT